MTQLKFNLDEISTVMVEPGRYRARLIKCEQTLSSTSKSPMLVWHWKIVSGKEKGKEIRSFTSLLPTALGQLKTHLEAFGFRGKVNIDTQSLIGRYVTLVVGVRSGVDRNGVDREFSNVIGLFEDGTNLQDPSILAGGKAKDQDEEEFEDEDLEDEDEDDEDIFEDEEEEPVSKPSKTVRRR